MIFDLIELLTLCFAFVALLFISKAFKSRERKDDRPLFLGFLFGTFFIFLNRVFTNIEVLFYGDILNFLEHLSIFLASIIFLCSLVWRAKHD